MFDNAYSECQFDLRLALNRLTACRQALFVVPRYPEILFEPSLTTLLRLQQTEDHSARVKACKGVLVTFRLIVQISLGVASKLIINGFGAKRLEKV